MIFGLFGRKKPKEEILLGKVVHYFPHVNAAVVRIEEGTVSIGDRIKVRGHTTEFEQKITSMQIEHKPVESASKGGEVAIQVKRKAKAGCQVFLVR